MAVYFVVEHEKLQALDSVLRYAYMKILESKQDKKVVEARDLVCLLTEQLSAAKKGIEDAKHNSQRKKNRMSGMR